MEPPSPVVSSHHLIEQATATAQMRRELAAAMRTPSILEPNLSPVLDILIESDGLRVEADGEAEVDIGSLPATTVSELHALLVAPQKMPSASTGGSGTTPIRRRTSAASTHVDAAAAAAPPLPPKSAAPAKDPPKPRRSFESLLREALFGVIQDEQLLQIAMMDVVTISCEDGVLQIDDEGEPTLDVDILDIPTMLKLYGALMRAKRGMAGANTV